MKYLLDTHSLLWITSDSKRISDRVKRIYRNESYEIFFSAASIWELAIKISLKKLSIYQELSLFVKEHIIDNNIQILKVIPIHLYPVQSLPFHHRDPFDRLLVAQCLTENITLISKDKVFDKYSIKRVW